MKYTEIPAGSTIEVEFVDKTKYGSRQIFVCSSVSENSIGLGLCMCSHDKGGQVVMGQSIKDIKSIKLLSLHNGMQKSEEVEMS